MVWHQPNRTRIRDATTLLGTALAISLSACDSPPQLRSDRTEGAKVVDAAALRGAPPGAVTWCTGTDTSGASQALADEYNTGSVATGHRIDLLELPGSRDDWHDQLVERQRGGSPECDILSADITWAAELAAEGWIYDLTPYLAPRRYQYLPTVLEAIGYEGKDWAAPFVADVGLLYYRTDQVATPPESWQQAYAAAAIGGGVVYQGSPGEGLTVNFLEIAYASGGRVLTADGKRAMIDSPENLAALRFLTDGVQTGVAPQAVRTLTEEPARRAFEAGRATFQRNWTSAWASAQTAPAISENFAAIALPPFEGGGAGGVLGGVNLLLSVHSDNPGAALRAIDWITSPQGQRLAAGRGLAPTLVALYDEVLVQEALPYHEALRQGIEQASAPPVSPAYRRISEVISTSVSNALNGRTTPEVALAEAEQQITQAIEDP